MSRTMRMILTLVGCLWLPAFATSGAAGEDCAFVNEPGPEEVCVTGVFPVGDIHVGPGDAKSFAVVEFANRSGREMRFSIEVERIDSGPRLFSTVQNSFTVGPGEVAEFRTVVFMDTDDMALIGSTQRAVLGVTASETGPGDFFATFFEEFQLIVGPDSDGDGLVDAWEVDGYNPDADEHVDIDLWAMGARPDHKDLFLEIDWHPGAEPSRAAIQEVKAAFAQAPVDAGGVENPDQLPGINLWIDTGDLDENGVLVGDDLGGGNEISLDHKVCGNTAGDPYYDAKEIEFESIRRGIFRYAIWARGCCTAGDPGKLDELCDRGSDCGVGGACRGRAASEIGGDDIYYPVSAARLTYLGPPEPWEAYTLMHEFGHLLNLAHGGSAKERFSNDPQATGAFERSEPNCEPNYVSIMNYNTSRLELADGTTVLDYSPARLAQGGRAVAPLPDLSETALDEGVALDPNDPDHYVKYSGPLECIGGSNDTGPCEDASVCAGAPCAHRQYTERINGQVDWNRDGTTVGAVQGNVDASYYVRNANGSTWSERNRATCGNEIGDFIRTGFEKSEYAVFASWPPRCGNGPDLGKICAANADCASPDPAQPELGSCLGPLTGHDDWGNISLAFRQFGDSASAPLNPVSVPEPSPLEIGQNLEWSNTADLSLAVAGAMDPLEASVVAEVEYELTVANLGPNPGRDPRALSTLPSGFAVVSADPGCSETAPGVMGCDLPALDPGEETSFSIRAAGTPECSDGLPKVVTLAASVENKAEFAGADPEPSNNFATRETQVLDTVPPELVLAVEPQTLWPPNHSLVPVRVTARVADSCDSAPVVRLVAISSSEPDDGLGDGATTADIQGAEIGSEDFEVLLRAERRGGGADRVYTIGYEAEDASGNTTSGDVTVRVPRARP